MKIKAHAKINLALNVVERRKDGYHELEMIMLPLDFCDEIEISISNRDSVEVIGGIIPKENTMTKAISLMKKTYNIEESFKVLATKHIPMEAGLAGGSADAAAVMKGINELCKLGISDEELSQLSLNIGADVPFCVIDKVSVVKGIGDIVEPFDNFCDFEILIVKPEAGVSTPLAFQSLRVDQCDHPNIPQLKKAMIGNDYEGMIQLVQNSLEESAYRLVPEIEEIKKDLIAFGFDCALMSGSGSSVFALTRDKELVKKALNELKYAFMVHTKIARKVNA